MELIQSNIFQYWESLREKLEKLEVSNEKCLVGDTREMSICEPVEGRERSLTGSSDTPSCNGERVVSGQSSSQESESSGVRSTEGVAQSCSSVSAEGAFSSSLNIVDSCDENVEEKLTKGRRTPPGSCLEVVDEVECPRNNISTELAVGNAAGNNFQGKQNCETTVVLSKIFHDAMHEKNCTNQQFRGKEINITEGCKLRGDGLEIIDLSEEADVFDGYLRDRNSEDEKGDGSSSPLPAPCQPSRNLTVIVEELEHCSLPE